MSQLKSKNDKIGESVMAKRSTFDGQKSSREKSSSVTPKEGVDDTSIPKHSKIQAKDDSTKSPALHQDPTKTNKPVIISPAIHTKSNEPLPDDVPSLKRIINEKNEEINKLNVIIEATASTTGINTSNLMEVINGELKRDQDPRDIKLIELAKKVRQLNVTNESLKTKNKRLIEDMKIKDDQLNDINISNNHIRSSTIAKKTAIVCSDSDVNIDSSSNNISDTNMKKLVSLEGECMKLKGLLLRELGDVDFAKVINAKSEWRGRQETIEKLQIKITKLESKLDINQVDERMQRKLSNIESNKTTQIRDNNAQIEKLTNENEHFSKIIAANKSRIEILESELYKSRDVVKTLLEKSRVDSELIESLRAIPQEPKPEIMTPSKNFQLIKDQKIKLELEEFKRKDEQSNEIIQQLREENKTLLDTLNENPRPIDIVEYKQLKRVNTLLLEERKKLNEIIEQLKKDMKKKENLVYRNIVSINSNFVKKSPTEQVKQLQSTIDQLQKYIYSFVQEKDIQYNDLQNFTYSVIERTNEQVSMYRQFILELNGCDLVQQEIINENTQLKNQLMQFQKQSLPNK